ncbi:MAG: histidine kinase [Vallitaleaceae bacterium]|nr:histidine kinase [Vallitaleaceae bacterium]
MKQRRFDEFTQIFLVNASQMAYLEDAPSTQLMLQKFYELFRYFLRRDNQILLANEMDALKNYIDIQKIRYGNRFDINLLNHTEFDYIFINHLVIIDFFDQLLNNALVQYEKIIGFTVEVVSDKDICLKVTLKTDSMVEEFFRVLVEEGDINV